MFVLIIKESLALRQIQSFQQVFYYAEVFVTNEPSHFCLNLVFWLDITQEFIIFCTELNSGQQKVWLLPEWSWHIFSQIATDLLAAANSIITFKLKSSNGHVN
jgi:hypothetical protein